MEGPAHAVGGHQTANQTTIVPTRAMNLLERAITDGDGEVQIAARANDILVRSPRFTIYSRLVEGRFPKWRDVFPRRTDVVKTELAVGPFYAAVRQAAIATSEESRGVDFTFDNGLLVLSGRAADVGQSRVELPIAYSGPKITITLGSTVRQRFPPRARSGKNIHLGIEGFRQRGGLLHGRWLRLRHHAAGPRSLTDLRARAVLSPVFLGFRCSLALMKWHNRGKLAMC